MKWRDLERGSTQGRTEDFELRPGVTAKIRVVPFLGDRAYAEIEAGAGAYVAAENKRRKAETPDAPEAIAKPGEPTYERGVYAHTVLRSVLDPEDGAPVFCSIQEMLDPDDGLDRDRLAMLFELQQQAQADFAPQRGNLTHEQFFATLEKTAEAPEGTDLPFEPWPRAMRRKYHRGIALHCKELSTVALFLAQENSQLRSQIASLQDKSSPGSATPDETKNSARSAAPSTSVPGGDP